jgi:ParB family chromosome partitioning protein
VPDTGYLHLDRAVDTINIGVRHRKDLGNLDALVDSIRQRGLLQPITVSPDGVLVCGWRRLEAVKRLGWTTVRVWVRTGISEGLAALLAEQDENTVRQDYTFVELEALYREVKILKTEDAARRQAATQFGAQPRGGRDESGNSGAVTVTSPEEPGTTGKVREKAALLVTGHQSQTTLERVAALRDIAEDDAQSPHARRVAVEALAAIQGGAPVGPTHDRALAKIREGTRPKAPGKGADVEQPKLGDLAAAAIDRLEKNGPRAPTPQPFRHTLRSWVLIWKDLDGWEAHYDPAEVATTVSDAEWERFVHVAESIDQFRDLGIAARRAGVPESDPDVDESTSTPADDGRRLSLVRT